MGDKIKALVTGLMLALFLALIYGLWWIVSKINLEFAEWVKPVYAFFSVVVAGVALVYFLKSKAEAVKPISEEPEQPAGEPDQVHQGDGDLHQGDAATSDEPQDLRKQLEQRGFRPDRIERALTERRIKDGKPDLSYPAVAMKAGEELGGEVEVTEDDVRNDYRDAGWIWEWARRVR